ncbi:MAG: TonB-dependent receptor [Muribaculaceae bacterium]|nr:TonB-dependent receptor [Muribaculaceae bacterium]
MYIFQRIAAVAFSAFALTQGAAAYSVSGRLTDTEGEGLPYATVRIYSATDSLKPLMSFTAGEDGDFLRTLESPGKYSLVGSYVGLADKRENFEVNTANPDAALGQLTMSPEGEMLQTFTISATRPLVTKEIDRIGYDVQADVETPTSSLSDMLKKVPMVSVDTEGNITVNGSSNYKIYKNGRPNSSMTNNAKDVLAAIPASMIKRIEVITEPGARYDAEGVGAILNIVTVENTSIKGVMGNVALNMKTTNAVPSANAFITSQIDKLTFSLNGGYFNRRGKESDGVSGSSYLYGDGSRMTGNTNSHRPSDGGYWGFEASLDLDTLNLITAEVNGFVWRGNNSGMSTTAMMRPDGTLQYSYTSHTKYAHSSYVGIDANFNYQRLTRRKGENITFSYQISNNNNNSDDEQTYTDLVNAPMSYTGIISDSKQHFIEHTFQLDWTRPLHKNGSLDLGGKFILRRNTADSEREYIGSGTTLTDFLHLTDVGAMYAQYSYMYGPLSARAGVRYEYSRLHADDRTVEGSKYTSHLNDLVPSAALSWQINQANSLSFNFATRISRPDIGSLDPTVTETPTSVSYGNPDLGSVHSYSFKLNWMLIKRNFNCNLTANYSLSNKGIAQVSWVDADNIIHSTYENLGHNRSLNFSGFMQWSITGTTSWMLNANISYDRYSQLGMTLGRWSPFFYTRISQRLPADWTVELSAMRFGGWTGSVYSYGDAGSFSNSFGWSLGVNKSFFDKRLNLRAEAVSPIGPGTRYFYSHTVNGGYTGDAYEAINGLKSVRFSISYRFGSLNAHVKKTKSISNDDTNSNQPSSGNGMSM